MPEQLPDEIFRAGRAGRWLPHFLAGSVLAGATLAAWHLDPLGGSVLIRVVRPCIAAAGGLLALGLLRYGAEVRQHVRVGADGLQIAVGRRRRSLGYDEIVRWGWAAPFAGTRHWLPALEILDRFGQVWRVSALLESGDRLVASVLGRTERHDLAAWAETARLGPRMRRVVGRVVIGYVTGAAVLAATAWHVWR